MNGAHLQGATLTEAHLQGADLVQAHLQGISLRFAYLQGAFLINARMQEVKLLRAHLQGANLWGTYLQGANLGEARLQGANLWGTYLQGADLLGARLQGANLSGVHLQGVVGVRHLPEDFQGELHQREAEVRRSLREPSRFANRLGGSIGEESDLSGVTFAGGLTPKDVNSLVEGLSDEKADNLRERLEPHIGQSASNELPENSGAIIKPPYTKEKAEQWIAENKVAMSEFPEDYS